MINDRISFTDYRILAILFIRFELIISLFLQHRISFFNLPWVGSPINPIVAAVVWFASLRNGFHSIFQVFKLCRVFVCSLVLGFCSADVLGGTAYFSSPTLPLLVLSSV